MMEKTVATIEAVRSSLKSVIEPELGLNIIDLGLVRGIYVTERRIDIDLTLPRPDSPKVGAIAANVEQTVRGAFEEVDTVEVSLVWDPPWSLEHLSEKGRKLLDIDA